MNPTIVTIAAQRRRALLGTGALTAGFVAIWCFAAGTLPWIGTADAYDHLDYVFQLGQGRLPEQYGHFWDAVGSTRAPDEGRQFASAHPPLFYMIADLLAGRFLAGDWHLAVAIIRLLDLGFGLVGLVTLALIGWMLGGARRDVLAIGMAGLGTAVFPYLRFSAEVYNDMLVAAAALVILAISIRMLLRGPTWIDVAMVAVASAVAMGGRATAAAIVGLAVAALLAACILATDMSRSRRIAIAIGGSAAVVALPLIAFGWFYARNAALSGSWYRSTPKSPVGSRDSRSTIDNLLDPQFWLIVPQRLLGNRNQFLGADVNMWSSALAAILIGATVVVLVVRIVRRRGWPIDIRRTAALVLLALALAATYAMQLSHATGYGQYSLRYFLPATASIALLLAGGFACAPRRLGAIAIPAAIGTMWWMNSASFVGYSAPADSAGDPAGMLREASVLAGSLGLPPWITTAAVIVASVSLLALVFVLWPSGAERLRSQHATAPLPRPEALQ